MPSPRAGAAGVGIDRRAPVPAPGDERPKASGACLVAGLAAIAIYYLLRGLAQDVLYDAVRVGAAGAILVGARRRRRADARPWYLIAVGQLLFALGDVTWDFFKHVQHTDPFPSLSDAFYLAAYPALAVGMLLLVRQRRPGQDRAALIDASIVATGVGLVVWVLLMQPTAHDPGLSVVERVISLAYPLMDIVLVAMAVRLAYVRGGRRSASQLLYLGLISLLGADTAFLATQLAGSYHDGMLIDAAFLLSGVLWAAAALQERADATPEVEVVVEADDLLTNDRARVAVVFGAALAGPLAIAVEAMRGVKVDVAVTIGGSIALVALALLRMASSDVERRIRNLALAAAAVGTIVTLAVTAIPALRVTYSSSELRAAIETAQALIALLVTHLLYLRFRKTRLLGDLVLVYGMGMLGVANVLFVVALSDGDGASGTSFRTWAPLITRAVAALAIVWAAWSPPRRVRARHVVPGVVAAHLASTALIAAGVVAFHDHLAVGVAVAPIGGGVRQSELVAHPVVLGAQLVFMVLIWLGAGGFVHRSSDDAGPLTAALAAGFILAGFSRLSFSLYPSLYTDLVHTGDFLRLGAYLVFLVGAEREIRNYWQGLAQAAVSEERERTARELHDGLVQELSFIRSQTAGLTSGRPNPVLLEQVALAADRALEESRHAVRVLSGDTAEEVTVALRRAAEEVAVRSGARVQLDARASRDLPAEVIAPLARIVREACSNAVRHGGAKQIVVSVEPCERQSLRITIADDGTGFDPEAVSARSGFGLRSMRERTAAMGGRLSFSSAVGAGTVVELVIPT